jgi:solute carrier family 25 carnitine/acylcarnitine transporter 20/29
LYPNDAIRPRRKDDDMKTKEGDDFARNAADDLVAGVIAGAACTLAGHPFDSIKVYQQVMRTPMTMLEATTRVVRARGVFGGLYAGVAAPMIGASLETGMNYACYHAVRERALAGVDASTSYSVESGASASMGVRLGASAFAGGVAGALMTTVLTPFELVKCRAQAGRGGTLAVAAEVYRERGVRGYFRGFTHTLFREVPAGMVYFISYETLQTLARSTYASRVVNVDDDVDGFSSADSSSAALTKAATAITCGGLAGVITWLTILPFDVVKTLHQCAHPGSGSPHDASPFILLRRVVAERGFGGLYRGAKPLLARAFPANAAQWLAWEYASSALGERRRRDRPIDRSIDR